jgi:hypothetical protein
MRIHIGKLPADCAARGYLEEYINPPEFIASAAAQEEAEQEAREAQAAPRSPSATCWVP